MTPLVTNRIFLFPFAPAALTEEELIYCLGVETMLVSVFTLHRKSNICQV